MRTRFLHPLGKLRHPPDSVIYLGLAGLFVWTFTSTLLPSLHSFGDITKAQFVGRLLGTTHPPGYPLYNLLTWAFSWLPFGSLAQRINAFSAACAVGTVLLLFRLQRIELGVGRWPALLSTCAFGWSVTFWSQSVIAEVYTLNSFLIISVLCSLLAWRRTDSVRWYLAACGLYALSFGNHLTVVTLLPAFCYAVFTSNRAVLKSPRLVASVVGIIVACASLYLYPLWRTHAGSLYLEYRIRDFSSLVDYVTGERYRSKMLAFGLDELLQKRLPRFTGQLAQELGPLALLAPAGAWLCRPTYARGVLLLGLLGQLLWVLTYDIPDIEIYMIPVALLAAVFVGIALDALGGSILSARIIAGVAAATLVLALFAMNRQALRHDKHVKFTAEVDRDLSTLGEGAVIAGIIHYGPRMAYVHRLVAERLGERRNLHLSYSAQPAMVAKYLQGKQTLKNSHTGERIGLGLRVYITPRAESAPWREAGLALGPRRKGMRQVTLAQARAH